MGETQERDFEIADNERKTNQNILKQMRDEGYFRPKIMDEEEKLLPNTQKIKEHFEKINKNKGVD